MERIGLAVGDVVTSCRWTSPARPYVEFNAGLRPKGHPVTLHSSDAILIGEHSTGGASTGLEAWDFISPTVTIHFYSRRRYEAPRPLYRAANGYMFGHVM